MSNTTKSSKSNWKKSSTGSKRSTTANRSVSSKARTSVKRSTSGFSSSSVKNSSSSKHASKHHHVDVKPIKAKLNKAETYKKIAHHTGLSQKDVKNVFAVHNALLKGSVMKGGCGEFVLHDFGIKVERVYETKGHHGSDSHRSGYKTTSRGKKETKSIKVKALKSLKDAVEIV